MDDHEWLRRLLEASRTALEHARSQGEDAELIAGLVKLSEDLERRLAAEYAGKPRRG